MEGSVVNIDVGKLLVREFDGESMSWVSGYCATILGEKGWGATRGMIKRRCEKTKW